jgi:hypothetical protein
MKHNWIRLLPGCISIFILLTRPLVTETTMPKTVIATTLTRAAPQTMDFPVNVKASGRADISALNRRADSPAAPLEAGIYQWHTFYGSVTNDYGFGITVDDNGGVYITGVSVVSWDGPAGQVPLNAFSGYSDIFVLKLDSAGVYQWHTFYGDNAIGTGIAMDSNGGVYISGYSRSSWDGPASQGPLHTYNGDYDIVVLKLDAAGAYQWHTFYGSTSADNGYGLAVDTNGGVYITGNSAASWDGPAGQAPLHAFLGSTDLLALKLDAAGAYQWHTFFGYEAAGIGIAVNSNGSVYISGSSHGLWLGPTGQGPLHDYNGLEDIVVLELDPAGAYQWHTFYGSPYIDEVYGLAVDGNGGIYITGTSIYSWNGPAGQEPKHAYNQGYDIFVLKLNAVGAYQWHTFYGSTSTDTGDGIAVDNNRGVYITGHYGEYGWIVVYKFDTAGAYQWVNTYGMGCYDEGHGIVVDNSGRVYSTGTSQCSWNGPFGQAPKHAFINQDIFVLKLQNISGIIESVFLPLLIK